MSRSHTRRGLLRDLSSLGLAAALPGAFAIPQLARAASGDELPRLDGELTLYLGRGEGGLYENVLKAIEERNPGLKLGVRRGPTAALANAIVAERRPQYWRSCEPVTKRLDSRFERIIFPLMAD